MTRIFTPRIAGWRMLPPAGAPFTAETLLSALAVLRRRSPGKPEEKALRASLGKRFGARHVRFADTGRAALSLALQTLAKRSPGRDEVLVPAYVSFSVPSAVVNAGLKVRLYDVNPGDLTPEYASLRHAASERALAVIICHQFGLPFDPSPAAALCREYGLTLIDDAAQVMGGSIGNVPAGRFGDVGLFSLSRGKPVSAVDGGVLLTDSDDLARDMDAISAKIPKGPGDAAKVMKALALFVLRRPEFYRLPASIPWLKIGASVFDPAFQASPISCFSASLAFFALRLLDEANASRRRAAEEYHRRLAQNPFIRLIDPQPESIPVYLRFPLMPENGGEERLQSLMRAKNGLSARNLGISRGFPLALSAIPALKPHLANPGGKFPGEQFPGAHYLAENLITLPTHDQVKIEDREAVIRFLTGSGTEPETGAKSGRKAGPGKTAKNGSGISTKAWPQSALETGRPRP